MLTAFDWTLDFDEAVTALGVHLNKASDLVNESVKSQCKAASARSGMAMDVLMAEPPLSTMTLMFDVEFGNPTIATSPETAQSSHTD
ncbi:MAG: hypothetical protein WA624_03720 [Methylocella sp.]